MRSLRSTNKENSGSRSQQNQVQGLDTNGQRRQKLVEVELHNFLLGPGAYRDARVSHLPSIEKPFTYLDMSQTRNVVALPT
jgi:hypothetical protein